MTRRFRPVLAFLGATGIALVLAATDLMQAQGQPVGGDVQQAALRYSAEDIRKLMAPARVGRSEPYEIEAHGRPTGLVELPVDGNLRETERKDGLMEV